MPQYLETKSPSQEHLQKCIEFFRKYGYLVIPHVLNPERCQQLKANLEQYLKQKTLLKNQRIFCGYRIFERSQIISFCTL